MPSGPLSNPHLKTIGILTICGLLVLAAVYRYLNQKERPGEEDIRGYHFGNSFTTDSLPMLLPHIFKAARRNESIYVGHFIRGGASLTKILDSFLQEMPEENDDFFLKSWDYISLQPWVFGNQDTLQAEIDTFNEFIRLTRGTPGTMEADRNGETVFYLYVPWVFQNPQHGETGSQFTRSTALSELWENGNYKKADETIQQTRNRIHYTHNQAMFDDFYEALVSDNPKVTIYQIPVGYVLSELDKTVRNNPIRNKDGTFLMDDIFVTSGIFRDYLHLNIRGQYVANTTTACVIFDMHPKKIPLVDYFHQPGITPEFIEVANDVIWDYLVQHEAVTGITARNINKSKDF